MSFSGLKEYKTICAYPGSKSNFYKLFDYNNSLKLTNKNNM